jgi:hypothetical protein
MEPKNKFWIVAFSVLVFLGGLLFAEFAPRANAQAQSAILPPIFEEGARLIGPTGSVEIHEIMGGWVRVKSLSALARPGEELWMYVPSLAGAWTVDTQPVEEKK